MKNWFVNAGVGLVCFGLGFFLKGSPEPAASPSSAVAQESPPASPAGSSRALFQPSPSTSSLSSRLNEIDPSLLGQSLSSLEITLFEDMFFKLASEDAQAAADFLTASPDIDNWTGVALEFTSEWSRNDPAAAYQWSLANFENFSEAEYDSVVGEVLFHYARKDPAKVAGLLGEMRNEDVLGDVSRAVASQWGRQDHQAALKWLTEGEGKNLPDSAYTESYQQIMRGYLTKETQEAAFYIQQLDSSPLKFSLLSDAGRLMATKDLNIASEWIRGLDDSAAKRAGLLGILASEAAQNPTKAWDLLVSNPEALLDDPEFVTQSFNDLVESSPNLAKDRFDELPPSAQGPVAREVIFNLANSPSGSAEVAQWIEALPRGEVFDQGVDAMARARSLNAPAEAMQWAGRIENSATRTELVVNLVTDAEGETLNELANSLGQVPLADEDRAQITALIEERLKATLPTLVIPE